MFVASFLGDHLRSPLVGGRVAVTMKNFGGVVTEERVDLVLALLVRICELS